MYDDGALEGIGDAMSWGVLVLSFQDCMYCRSLLVTLSPPFQQAQCLCTHFLAVASHDRETLQNPTEPLVVSKSLISDAYLELATNIRKPAVDLRNLNVVARQKENPKVVTERRSFAFDCEDLKGATGARHEETICFGGPDAPSKLPHVRHQLILSCHDCQLYPRAFRGVAVRQFFSHHLFRCR